MVDEQATEAAAMAPVLERYAVASEGLKDRLDRVIRSTWLSFEGWYDAGLVAAIAKQTADLSLAAQHTATGLSSEYVRQVLDALQHRVGAVRPVAPPVIRNGVPLDLVYTRPVEVYRRAVATGSDTHEALDRAIQRAADLARSDVALTERQAEQGQLEDLGITHYRRVIRPELSKSGTCGLCAVASHRVYKIADLMPIHPPNCKCKTAPIVDGKDPGGLINDEDLKQLYAAAGDSTHGDDLKRVRVQVNEHGELGPILGRHGDSFRTKRQVPLEQDPERAARMLAKTLPVLEDLEKRAARGAHLAGPLDYQRELVQRLRHITEAAA